jgi:hypothetical protein
MSGRDRLNFRFLESVIPSEAADEVEESLDVGMKWKKLRCLDSARHDRCAEVFT